MSVNKVILLGRLGKDPELKATPSGNQVCHFSLATSESWKDKRSGEKQEKTEWSNCVVWGNLALIAERYLKKGSQCYVEGKLETRKWDDKNGVTRYSTEIIVSTLQLIDRPSDNETAPQRIGNVTEKIHDARAFDDNANFGGTDFNGRSTTKTPAPVYNQDEIPF